MDKRFSEWIPTEDGYYSDSRGAMYRPGNHFDRLQIEQYAGEWWGMAYKRSAPRDDFGNFSFDLWPDDDGVRYDLVVQGSSPSKDSIMEFCEGVDTSAHEWFTNE